jgi:transposase-like protein
VVVDLTCQHKNQALLVEGPEVMIRPVGTRPQSMRGRFSAAELQTMIDLYQSGATAEQVAQTYGFSKRSIKRLLQQHGVRRERRTKA